MRISRICLSVMFSRYVKAIGGHVADSYNDVGGFTLDHNSVYGGWLIEQIGCENGSVNHPFGSRRMKIGELYEALSFAIYSIEYLKFKQEQLNKYEVV